MDQNIYSAASENLYTINQTLYYNYINMDNTILPYDTNNPIQVASGIWWVGHYLEEDSFQCHSYLIENGSDSILIDPGSRLTFNKTYEKIEQITPFNNIRYFIVNHPDPDITGALDTIDNIITREDACILSHWRSIALLKHLDLKIPLRCVEKMNWQLKTGDRELQFIFTPYLHFPGAFCTFDKGTGSLFSSDIAGGFTEGFSLYAVDESYMESVKLFHEHYMPSREILAFTIRKFEELPLKRILPQHGSIITGKLVPFILDQLKNLDCGLYLMTKTDTDIQKLSKLNRFLNDFIKTLVSNRHFDSTARQLLKHIQKIIPAKSIKFLIISDSKTWQLLEEETRFQGTSYKPDEKLFEIYQSILNSRDDSVHTFGENNSTVILPLSDAESGIILALSLIDLSVGMKIDEETYNILKKVSAPLCIAVEREIIQQKIYREKQSFYEQAIKDPLTDLYNRTYMNETIPRIFSHHDRGLLKEIVLLMLDLDHFKAVNDTFGHNTGDIVLKRVSEIIQKSLRAGDFAVRVGGEEIAVFLVLESPEFKMSIADRIRNEIKSIDFSDCMYSKKQTISGGAVLRKKKETLEELFARADKCLYQSKKSGRDKISEE